MKAFALLLGAAGASSVINEATKLQLSSGRGGGVARRPSSTLDSPLRSSRNRRIQSALRRRRLTTTTTVFSGTCASNGFADLDAAECEAFCDSPSCSFNLSGENWSGPHGCYFAMFPIFVNFNTLTTSQTGKTCSDVGGCICGDALVGPVPASTASFKEEICDGPKRRPDLGARRRPTARAQAPTSTASRASRTAAGSGVDFHGSSTRVEARRDVP